MSIGKQDLQELAQGLGEYRQKYAMDLARTEAMMGDPRRLNVLLEEQQEKQLDDFVKQNPQFAEMYKIFGEKGLKTAYLQKQEEERQQIMTAKQLENLRKAGFDESSLSLYLAGLPIKDILEIQKLSTLPDPKTPEQLTTEVEQEKLQNPEYLKTLQNFDQAFSPIDAAQQQINKYVAPIFPFLYAEDTGEAVAAKNVLNENIREKFINQYSGKPSVYISKRVDTLLPQGEFMDEKLAASKYKSIQNVLKEGLNEMKSNIDSGLYSGTERQEVENNYKNIQSLVTDLDIVLRSLNKEKGNSESIYGPTGFAPSGSPTGTYNNFFLENNNG